MATGTAPWPRFSIDEAVMFHVAARPSARPDTPAGVPDAFKDFLDQVQRERVMNGTDESDKRVCEIRQVENVQG
jgi:hypothetical protein